MLKARLAQKLIVEIANIASDGADYYVVVTKPKNRAKKPPATTKP